MGKIKPGKNSVVVEMSLTELITQKTYIKLPDEKRLWVDYLGNMILRAAGKILHEKASHLSKTYDKVTVSGTGTVVVKFEMEETE